MEEWLRLNRGARGLTTALLVYTYHNSNSNRLMLSSHKRCRNCDQDLSEGAAVRQGTAGHLGGPNSLKQAYTWSDTE